MRRKVPPKTSAEQLETLYQDLCSPDPEAYLRGEQTAIKLGKRAIPILIEVLDGPESIGRTIARRRLVALGDAALPALRELATSDTAVHRPYDILRDLGDPMGVQKYYQSIRERATTRNRPRMGWPKFLAIAALLMGGTSHVLHVVLGRHASGVAAVVTQFVFNGLSMAYIYKGQVTDEPTFLLFSKKEDMQSFNVLCFTLAGSSTELEEKARLLLIERLPNLTLADARAIDDHALKILLKAFDKPSLEEGVALLDALIRVGDRRAVPRLERWADGKGAGERTLLREMAQTALGQIAIREKQTKDNLALLRPSDAPDTLLRPASEDADRLLRPVE